MNINDLDEYEIESEAPKSNKPLNLADLGDDFEIEKESVSPSEIDSGLRGLAQGATFGLADEITGGLEAGGKALFGDDKIADILDNYRKYRDESRANYKAAEEANPASYFAGELTGGIGTGLLSGGAGVVANAGKAGLGQLAKQGAKIGLAQGAISGAGYSDADLTQGEVGEFAKDVGGNAAAGAAIGGALPAVIQGTKGTKNLITKGADDVLDVLPSPVKSAIDAFKMTSKGKSVVGSGAKEAINEDAMVLAEKILTDVDKQYKTGSKMVGKALEKSDVGPQNMSAQLRELEKAVSDKKIQPEDLDKIKQTLALYKRQFTKETVQETGIDKALKKLDKAVAKAEAQASELGHDFNAQAPKVFQDEGFAQRMVTEATPEGNILPKVLQADIPEDTILKETLEGWNNMSLAELQNLKSQLGDLAYSESLGSSGGKGQAKMLYNKVNELIESKIKDPQLKSLYERGNKKMTKIHEASDLMTEIGPSADIASDKNMINLAEKLKSSKDKQSNLRNSLSELLENNNTLVNEADDIARRSELNRHTINEGLLGMMGPQSLATRAGAAAGRINQATQGTAKALGKTVASPAKFTQNIMKASEDQLQNAAQGLANSSNPVIQDFGRKLSNALSSTDKKDRLIWALSQQPAFREAVREILPDIDFDGDGN